ncbi:ribosome small subunit-dependent GTPase A [Alteromonas facilis]|uniref:ribosome small subunit-dependent GTPase A n=1 Tax=Alteromonas facilis TaxID=2048004 RepID=UPI000C292D4C|nr:ribosome small subunit-dependent GTPase A [Alteromonas facilis]
MTNYHALSSIGWSPFFQQQLSLDEWDEVIPARVVEQHKSIIGLTTESEDLSLELTHNMPAMVVGDWVLLDKEHRFYRLLERKTCFRRKSAGAEVDWQLIAANVDTAFIVCSLNDDFNLSRIERYLSLANSADVEPVVVLTKSDLVEDPEAWVKKVHEMDRNLPVVAVNALSSECTEGLNEWLGTGRTVVILGSSGVGKSTITNTLLGEQRQAKGCIRSDDDKGRHTTTNRSLLGIPSGGMILDTPGMRELQIADCQDGIASTFSDIEALASKCRFSDCNHVGEPGCAVIEAVSAGELDARRLKNYLKLLKEEAMNSASLSQKRAKDKALGKFYKRTLVDSYKIKGRY